MELSGIKEFLSTPEGIFAVLFPLRLIIYGVFERVFTAHRFNARKVIFIDLATTFFLVLFTLPIANRVIGWMGIGMAVPEAVASLPWLVRLLLFLVLADFAHYWVHRLMHHRLLWRVHRWHHAPTHMSWAAGNRESLPDAILVNSAYAFFWPVIGSAPGWVFAGLMVFSTLKNDWMHLNVRWSMPWLEWLVVTPRYHHIHHSADPAHYNSNYGIIFSVWDRMFGTYTPPVKQRDSLQFGIADPPPLPRLFAGL